MDQIKVSITPYPDLSKRRGYLHVSDELITDALKAPATIQLIFRVFYPISTWDKDFSQPNTTTYEGYSPLFDEVGPYDTTPEYTLLITRDGGNDYVISVEHIKEFAREQPTIDQINEFISSVEPAYPAKETVTRAIVDDPEGAIDTAVFMTQEGLENLHKMAGKPLVGVMENGVLRIKPSE